MYCSSCGKTKDEGRFCNHCGKESISEQKLEPIEKIVHKTKKLSAEDLPEKIWWRFARAIFGLGSTILVIITLFGLGIALNDTNIVDENQSEFKCSSGEQYQLSEITENLKITSYYSNGISSNRFTGSNNDAKARIFCQALNYNRDSDSGPLTWIDFIETSRLLESASQETFALFAVNEATSGRYGTLNELAEDKYVIAQVKDVDYTINSTYDFSPWLPIFGFTLLALIIEVIVLLAIRGIVRYTLIGKFF